MSEPTYTFSAEDVARGAVSSLLPLEVQFSPYFGTSVNSDSSDGGGARGLKLTYLYPDSSGVRQVHVVDLGGHPTAGEDTDSEGEFASKLLFDATKGQHGGELSLQEQLRRERMRLFTQGVASYQWAPASASTAPSTTSPQEPLPVTEGRMMIPMNGQILIYDGCIGGVFVLYDGSHGEAYDPQMSPDGQFVAFVIKNDLYVLPVQLGVTGLKPVRLTTQGAVEGFSCGVADYIAQEEMHRFKGFWWSPNSSRLAFTIVDERHIPVYHIPHSSSSDPHHVEHHRYPFTGERNAIVRVAAIDLNRAAINLTANPAGNSDADTAADEVPPAVVFDVCADGSNRDSWRDDHYIGRVGFWPDNSVMIQVQNRQQNVLDLLRCDLATGLCSTVLRETSQSWVNLHDVCSSISQSAKDAWRFVWASERSGFSQLYLYTVTVTEAAATSGSSGSTAGTTTVTATCELDGQPIGGGGAWSVDSIAAIDERNELVYFMANKDTPVDKQLYCASYSASSDTSVTTRITPEPGWHSCVVHPESGYFVDIYSSLNAPAVTQLCRLNRDGPSNALRSVVKVLRQSKDWDAQRFSAVEDSLVVPEIRSVRSRDGRHLLYYCLYRPRAGTSAGTAGGYPTVVSVYGGPHVQYVTNQWIVRSDMRAQMLAQQGYLVIRVDNRGSARRGLDFESAIYEDMGNLEVDDQAHVVQCLAAEGLVDPSRVGIYGWSYGGYMTLMCLSRAADVFSAGVSGAPVTSWDGYDTHYSERYMNLPAANPDGYARSSVMEHVSQLSNANKLMLIHGLIDENVHFRHTSRLIDAMIRAKKRYQLLLFPSERHSPHKLTDRVFMCDEINRFFLEALPLNATNSTATTTTAANAHANANTKVFSKM